jgi:hypothetical protein
MDNSAERRNVPVKDRLHPLVWVALLGFVAWFVTALWGFGMEGYADWLLFVVSAFVFIAVMIPVILSRVGRSTEIPDAQPTRETFREWASGEFQTWQDRSKALNAATEIILPIAAAAVGMTAFAIVFRYAAARAGA